MTPNHEKWPSLDQASDSGGRRRAQSSTCTHVNLGALAMLPVFE
eukprot:CAMPEP_0114122222 /NCGR_PEP_ID=MMETSP0043_2-20121206/7583_1 /TAXON_ID=464988 /ORGANISM="Hemiselmis andersenii, Strain CCMP644" /LENGTH=43 /DNA_ID= /DNA_START= /DNA_END= /DNA_ORIENTATION=